MTLIFKGVIILIVLKIASEWFNFVTIGLILEYLIMWGPLALIIIFQPEIRNVLEQLGRSQLLGRHKTLTISEREKMVSEIVSALAVMLDIGIMEITIINAIKTDKNLFVLFLRIFRLHLSLR